MPEAPHRLRRWSDAVTRNVKRPDRCIPGMVRVAAARRRGQGARRASGAARVRQPFIVRIVTWPDAGKAQIWIAVFSAEGRTTWVLIRRSNVSCKRSMALEPFHVDRG